MAAHSSVVAWRLPGTGEPGGLPSLGSHRVGHDWSNDAAAAAGSNSVKGRGRASECLGVWWYLPLRTMGKEVFVTLDFLQR